MWSSFSKFMMTVEEKKIVKHLFEVCIPIFSVITFKTIISYCFLLSYFRFHAHFSLLCPCTQNQPQFCWKLALSLAKNESKFGCGRDCLHLWPKTNPNLAVVEICPRYIYTFTQTCIFFSCLMQLFVYNFRSRRKNKT